MSRDLGRIGMTSLLQFTELSLCPLHGGGGFAGPLVVVCEVFRMQRLRSVWSHAKHFAWR